MVIGCLRISLRLHASASLKDKRRPRQAIVDGARARFKVAASEVADQDVWNLLTVAFATVGPERGPVEAVLKSVGAWVEEQYVGEIVDDALEFFRP
jgi:uncharacterized protein YlxP (DUF503 family)